MRPTSVTSALVFAMFSLAPMASGHLAPGSTDMERRYVVSDFRQDCHLYKAKQEF